jgi:hypothetical protein
MILLGGNSVRRPRSPDAARSQTRGPVEIDELAARLAWYGQASNRSVAVRDAVEAIFEAEARGLFRVEPGPVRFLDVALSS